jgi:hypothetical protein
LNRCIANVQNVRKTSNCTSRRPNQALCLGYQKHLKIILEIFVVKVKEGRVKYATKNIQQERSDSSWELEELMKGSVTVVGFVLIFALWILLG